MYMNRDTRKVITFLTNTFADRNVDYNVNHREVYLVDKLMIVYYPNPVVNILKSRIDNTKTLGSKHATISYWYAQINNILRDNPGAKRPATSDIQYTVPDELGAMMYWPIISGYLICDYSYDDMVLLHEAVNKYKYDDIQYAISVGKGTDIYDVRYLNAVLDRQHAKDMHKRRVAEQINQRIEQSDQILTTGIYDHNVMDIAQAEWNWQNSYENMRIENELNRISKGDKSI